jgi:hypothetical protein
METIYYKNFFFVLLCPFGHLSSSVSSPFSYSPVISLALPLIIYSSITFSCSLQGVASSWPVQKLHKLSLRVILVFPCLTAFSFIVYHLSFLFCALCFARFPFYIISSFCMFAPTIVSSHQDNPELVPPAPMSDQIGLIHCSFYEFFAQNA